MITNERHQKSSDDNNEQQDQMIDQYHLTTKKRVVFWLYLLSLLTFVVAISVLLSFTWIPIQQFTQSDHYYYANQVTYQWKNGYITDMKILKNNQQCPSGYEHGVNFNWPGTNFGCRCTPNSNISLVINGICTPTLIQRNCRNMDRIANLSTHYWRNQSNICIKRSTVSFMNQQKYVQANNNTKICGSSSSLVIMPINQPCPIVNISFNDVSIQNNYYQISDTNNLLQPLYATFNATSPYTFYNYPIAHLAVSQHQFCLIEEDTGLDPEHSDFVLLLKARGCAELGNYTQLGKTTQKQFYQNNPELQQLTNILGFPTPHSWEYKLGYTGLPNWKYQCRHNMDLRFNTNTAKDMFNFYFATTYQTIAIVVAVFITIISIQFLVLLLRRLFNSNIYPVGYKQVYLPAQFCKALARYIVDIVSKLIIFGTIFYLAYTSQYNWNWFKSAINQNCHDNSPQLIQNVLTPYTELYLKISRYTIAQCAIVVIFIVIDIMHFIHVYRNDLKYYIVQADGKLLFNGDQDKQNQKNKNVFGSLLMKDSSLQLKDQSGQEKQDPFRVTMALKIQDDQDMVKKPKIKKKNRKQLKMFNKINKKEQTHHGQHGEYIKAEDSQILYNNDDNPFTLFDSSIGNYDGNNQIYPESSEQKFNRTENRKKKKK